MKIKSNLLILILLISLFACKKDASLTVSSENFTFTNDVATKSLILNNDGEKDLDWSISNLPGWLSVSKDKGTIYGGSEDVISLSVDVHFDKGNYNSTFLVSTNGGDKNIIVDFNLDYEVSLFEGVGVDSFRLNETFSSISSKLGGNYDFYDSIHYEDNDLILHILGYDNSGIVLYIWNFADEVFDEDIVEMFGILEPYTGVLNNNIGINTPSQKVNQYYGSPEDSYLGQYEYYYYMSKGIDFLFDSDLVGLIWIYNPFTPQKSFDNNMRKRVYDKLANFR